jgi:hypothetical protein
MQIPSFRYFVIRTEIDLHKNPVSKYGSIEVLGVRASTYGFGGDTFQSITNRESNKK